MTRDEARQEIRENWKDLITGITRPAQRRVNGQTSYVCPLCGHGEHGDGLTVNTKSKNAGALICFACKFSGDILDLYQAYYKKELGQELDFNGALSLLSGELGLTVDGPQEGPSRPQERREAPQGYKDTPKTDPAPQGPQEGTQETIDLEPADYTQYYLECYGRLKDPDAVAYLKSRGISLQTALQLVGFDPAADPVNAPGGKGAAKYPAPRIIIPSAPGHYVGRAIDPANKYQKMNVKGGKAGLFNDYLLCRQDVELIFIVEGAFDALSIMEVGESAISLNSASNTGLLLEELGQEPTTATLVLCLDKDTAGKNATERLREGLTRLGTNFIVADIVGRYKDANERLTADRQGLEGAIEEAKRQTSAKPDNIADYIDNFMTADIAEFKQAIKTGFENLDKASGGLNSGLYILAAISSLGKTSFCLQLADQAAAAGQDVLYFSLEQSRLELVTKSLARITAQGPVGVSKPVSSLAIRRGYLPQQVLTAAKEYREKCGERLSVIEGNFTPSIAFIGDYISRYVDRNKVKPLVILDYLQILQPAETGARTTTKETVDLAVMQLKQLSRSMGLTIIAICSINRANYLTPIDFESLKESGNIEYTGDCIWGLQLHVISTPEYEKIPATNVTEKRRRVKEAKAAEPRLIDLVCLKNRYGKSSYSCSFEYYPANDLFIPVEDFPQEEAKRAARTIRG